MVVGGPGRDTGEDSIIYRGVLKANFWFPDWRKGLQCGGMKEKKNTAIFFGEELSQSCRSYAPWGCHESPGEKKGKKPTRGTKKSLKIARS